jgi:thiol-disulfide isomerase/thioredoxin
MRTTFLLFFIVWSSFQSIAQGIDFFHAPFEDALEMAKPDDKLIFVDAFTKWCGPCKRMSNNVFPLEEVGEFFNEHFINLKMDMEEGPGLEFGKNYPVNAYPTCFFISSDGSVVYKFVGGKDPESLIAEAKKALAAYSRSDEYSRQYADGKRDYDLVLKYVKALNNEGKPSKKISNDYLYSQQDITTKENLIFLHTSIVDSDSRLFELYTEHKKKILEYIPESEYTKKVIQACEKTVDKAIEFKNEDLLKLAQKHAKKYAKANAKSLKYKSDFEFAEAIQDDAMLIKATKKYIKKELNSEEKKGSHIIRHIERNHFENQEMMKLAEHLAETLCTQSDNPDQWMLYVKILIKNKAYKNAAKACNQALELAKAKDMDTRQIEGTIKYINSLIKV